MAMNVGGVLRQARQDSHVTLESVAERTKIRLRFLQAIDANDFDRLPDGVVRRGHLRAYAREVGLDPEQIVARYLREEASLRPPVEEEEVASPATLRLHLDAPYAQLRPLLQACYGTYHRGVNALHRVWLRVLRGTRLPQ